MSAIPNQGTFFKDRVLLEIGGEAKDDSPCSGRGITQKIALPGIAVIQPDNGLRGRPETDSWHDTPDIIIDILAGFIETGNIPVHVFQSAGKINYGFVPSQEPLFNNRLYEVYKPALLFCTELLGKGIGDINGYPSPLSDYKGFSPRQRGVEIHCKNMEVPPVIEGEAIL
jgi:hypothetical protein